MTHESAPPPGAGRPPVERALLVWLVAVTVLGGLWLWALVSVPRESAEIVAWGGGAAGLLLALSSALVAYFAASAGRARARLTTLRGGTVRLEEQISTLVEEVLPFVVAQVRDGASPEQALAAAQRRQSGPANHQLQRLLHGVARDVATAERQAETGRALAHTIEDELHHIVDVTLPEAVKRIRREKAGADRVLFDSVEPANPAVGQVLHDAVHALSGGERLAGATMMGCAGAAARLQAMVTSMLAELRELQFRYDEQPVFHDLLDLDHRASQMGRLADSIALLAGGRTGRRWTKPIRMESILRGAQGRIAGFRRVRLHSTSTSAVAGYAAEGVMHALAELMDNAVSFSARNTTVHVYVEDEDAGVVITVEDAGLGMRRRERDRAQRLVSRPPALDNLPGSRLGLAVVGRLARKHRLRVSFRPSARGGVGVVLMVPRHLLSQPAPDVFNPDARPALAASPPPVERREPEPAAVGHEPTAVGHEPDDLPQRRRGATLAASPYPVNDIHPGGGAAESPTRPGGAARFAAFRQAGRDRAQPEPHPEP